MSKLVILDAGHGVNTPGKRSPDGSVLEYEYNRRLVAAVAERLRSAGIETLVLVPETSDISLGERVRRANAAYLKSGKNAVLVSVHLNAAGNGSWMNARGWSVFVSPNASTASKKLAGCLFDSAENRGLRTRRPEPKTKYWTSNLYICRKTSCPAVLTENLFMDNKQDCELLKSSEGFEKLVLALADGVQAYING